MRILHITPAFRPSIGGIEAVVESLANHLNARGIESDVAYIARGLSFGNDVYKGYTVWRLPLFGHPFAGLAPHLSRIVDSYDLLHVHDPQLLAVTTSVMWFAAGKPAVLSTHGGFHHTNRFAMAKRLHERYLLPRMIRRYCRVLASSRADFDYFSQFTNKVILAENGVDVTRFSMITAAIDRSPWNWVYWGRLSRNKRLDLVVNLAKRARSLGFPVELTICGQDFDGSGEALRGNIDSATQLFTKVLGSVSDEALAELVASSGAYITASEHEGFGLTIIEALAAGLPVVCRDMAPLNGFVDETCGLLLDFNGSAIDDDKLGRFLQQLEHKHSALQACGRARAERFDWPKAIGRFIEEYRLAFQAEQRDGTN